MQERMLRMAMRLDAAGQHDLADAMERLATIFRAPFHLPTGLMRKLRGVAPEAFDDWVRAYKPHPDQLWDAALDLTRVHPDVYGTVEMPDKFFKWVGRNVHPDTYRGTDDVARREMEKLFQEVSGWRTGQLRDPQNWLRRRGVDPASGFRPGHSKYVTPPTGGPRPTAPPPPRPGPTPPPSGGPTTPPPSPPPPGPGPAGPPPRGPRTPPPGPTVPPPTPRPTPGVAEPDRGLWQSIPWWIKWPAIGYGGYRVFWPHPPRAPRKNVTPPQQVLDDPRQHFEDRPYNPYYRRGPGSWGQYGR